MKLAVVTPPSIEPVTPAEAKLHARIFYDDDDALISSLITAAREWLEARVARAFITQTLEDTRYVAPGTRIRLLRAPVQSVASVTVNGTTLDPSAYTVDPGTPGWVTIPDATLASLAPSPIGWLPSAAPSGQTVVIRYVAGYGDDATAVPETAKLIIKILASHLYNRREPIVTGTIVAEVPFTVEALCDPLRWGGSVPR